MTRWLVTGAGGQLGTRLVRRLADDDVVGLTRAHLDITRPADVAEALDAHRPDVVVNAAGYTAVDRAETDEQAAAGLNAAAVGHLAENAARLGARFIHVSTDYVFAGDADRPYDVDDPAAPRSAYGRTKLAGEQLAVRHGATVVRTAWVYGGPGPNFVDTILRKARQQDVLSVVDDQFGSPTYSADLADALVELGSARAPAGVVHYVNAGTASWFDLAREAVRLAGDDPERVQPTSSAQFVRPAPRPSWSVLSTRSWTELGLRAPRSWRAALAEHMASPERAGTRGGSARPAAPHPAQQVGAEPPSEP